MRLTRHFANPEYVMKRALLAVLICSVADYAAAQAPTAADGPWSGQMQCVLSVKGPDYQDEQTHTWRIVPGAPFLNGAFRQWPAVWSVQGSGSRGLATASETWKTAVPPTNAPLAFSVNAVTGQLRIGSQHGLLSINGAVIGTIKNAGGTQPITGGLQEWPFPIVDDVATATTISGTRTRTAANASGWRQPPGVPTTERCTWRFDKTAATNAPESQISAATGVTTTGSEPTLRPVGAGTIQSTTTETTSNTTLRRETAFPSAGAVSALNALAITVTYPNGGETLPIGTPINITWTHLLPSGTVFTADVSYDGGITWTPTQLNSSSGTLAWMVSGNAGTRTRVRMKTLDGATVDQSDADFTIAAASLRTITVAGFAATGLVPPRTITAAGFSATGLVPPRTITLSGWSAAGP